MGTIKKNLRNIKYFIRDAWWSFPLHTEHTMWVLRQELHATRTEKELLSQLLSESVRDREQLAVFSVKMGALAEDYRLEAKDYKLQSDALLCRVRIGLFFGGQDDANVNIISGRVSQFPLLGSTSPLPGQVWGSKTDYTRSVLVAELSEDKVVVVNTRTGRRTSVVKGNFLKSYTLTIQVPLQVPSAFIN